MVAVIVLAGCSDKPTAPEEDTEPATTGSIRGVVVTPTIQPIVGAVVSIDALGTEKQSDLFGRFRFTDLDPGTYVLRVSAERHDPTNLTVQVAAGASARPRVVLDPILPPVVQHTTLEFAGRVPAWLGPAENASQPAQNAAGVAGCQCMFDIPVPRYLVAVTVEAIWEDEITAPAGTEYQWNLTMDGASANGTGSAPLHDVVRDDDTGTFAPPMTLTIVPDAMWPTQEQEYEAFVTLWEVEDPPEGWSFIAGDR